MSFKIITDTSCDIPAELLQQWGMSCVSLTFHDEQSDRVYVPADISSYEFYRQMREGTVFKTAAANVEAFCDAFAPVLVEGKDILYIGFSSGLSTTVNSARIAAQDVQEHYPERKIIVIDTLCASGGEGFLVYLAMKKQLNNASLEETADYIEKLVPSICHWFTVDDLVYLKRGGRVSPATALVGNILGIKPILHVDDEGHLVKVSTIRGRKQSIAALADKYCELATGAEAGIYMITHGDCLEDAKRLEAILKDRTGQDATLIADVGPVIGSHSGPGTLALFFVGKHR